jgi:hypothetical protein
MTDSEMDLDELRLELDEFAKPNRQHARPPREERIIAGFEEIQRFYEENGRAPQHGEDRDIFERIYAARLDQIRKQADCRELVAEIDSQSLLVGSEQGEEAGLEDLDDDALLAELDGIGSEANDLQELKHVRPRAEVRAAEEVAQRQKCEDFDTFKPIFDQVQKELDSGVRETRPFEMKADIEEGRFFIVGGQKAYVAEMGEITTTDQGRTDARLRVIFDNGTESSMLMRSLQRALNKDEAGRRITDLTAGPLFSDKVLDGDEASGTIYVLRSKSSNPVVTENRELIHKIGVTNMSVKKRIQGARLQTTFLMADVEVVQTYELYNINRTKLENLIHKFFEAARINIEIKDRFGNPVVPREWFLVPFSEIDKAIDFIKDGTISERRYDPKEARIVEV